MACGRFCVGAKSLHSWAITCGVAQKLCSCETRQQSQMDDYDTPAPTCDDCFSPRAALAIRITAGTLAAVSFAWFTYATFPFPQPRRSRCDRISPAPAAVDCSSSLPFCAACNLAGNPGAPTLFHAQLQDGAGAVALQAVAIAAYAAERGWNYGGSFLPCAPGHVLCHGSCIREAKCPRLFTHAFTASEAIALLLGDGLTHSLAGVNSTESLATAFGTSRDDDRSAVVVRSVKALGRLQPPVAADILFTQTGLPWPEVGRLLTQPTFLAAFRRDACRVAARANGTRLFARAAVDRGARAARRPRRLGAAVRHRRRDGARPLDERFVFSRWRSHRRESCCRRPTFTSSRRPRAPRRRRIRSCGARTGGRARRCTSTR